MNMKALGTQTRKHPDRSITPSVIALGSPDAAHARCLGAGSSARDPRLPGSSPTSATYRWSPASSPAESQRPDPRLLAVPSALRIVWLLIGLSAAVGVRTTSASSAD